MVRYIVVVLILIFISLGAIYFLIGVPRVYSEEFSELPMAHSYEDESRPISEITLSAFYFVPQEKKDSISENWKELLEASLARLGEFHDIQFLGRSNINYAIYPSPIIGLKESIKYDTNITQHGNPQALRNVSEEIERRVFDSAGDLFLPDFMPFADSSAYPVFAILYEGVGAVGGLIYESKFELAEDIAEKLNLPESSIFIVDVESADGFFLINREFLDSQEYSKVGNTLFAHEFYHTIGMPDEYDISSNIPTSQDIMGSGRFKPLEDTFIDRISLKKLGL